MKYVDVSGSVHIVVGIIGLLWLLCEQEKYSTNTISFPRHFETDGMPPEYPLRHISHFHEMPI